MSDRLTYACTLLKTDDGEYVAGQVVRRKGTRDAWSDTLILGFSDPTKHGDVFVKMARPYAYASCVGTTGPGILMGCEEYTITAKQLVEGFTTMVGTPMISGSVGHKRPGQYESEVIDQRKAA